MERIIVNIKETKDGLFCKLREDGKLIYRQIPFHNYFFIREEDYDSVKNVCNQYCINIETIHNNDGTFMKLVLKNNFWRYKFKNVLEEDMEIQVFCGDVNTKKNFLIENQHILLNQDKINVLYLDIETDDRKPMDKDFSGTTLPTSCITAIAFKDLKEIVKTYYNTARDTEEGKHMKCLYEKLIMYKKQEVNPKNLKLIKDARQKIDEHAIIFDPILLEHEKYLLQNIIKYMKDSDMALAWNGWRFDFPILKGRCELHNLNYSENLVMDIDYMEVYKKNSYSNLDSYSLNNVAKHEFEEEVNNTNSKFKNLDEVQKIDWKELTGLTKFFEFYLLEPKLFEEYNIQDVNLMYLLEDKLKFLKIQFVLSKLCHCLLDESLHNSKSFDYAMLNEYSIDKLTAPSKPSKETKESWMHPIEGIFPPGAFTYIFKKGLTLNSECYDFKSQYPTNGVTYNISPDTLVESRLPDLSLVFNEKEIEYIKYCEGIAKKYLDSKGKLRKKKYETNIEVKRTELDVRNMTELMWRFVEFYEPSEKTQLELKERNLVMTPTDLNYSTRGWKVHPHHLFTHKKGVFPRLCEYFLTERDKVKYTMKKMEPKSFEYQEADSYQGALKTAGNSGYGYFAFKSSRFFCMEIPEAITTSSRFATKKSIIFAKHKGYESSHGDTDSAYLYNVTNEFSLEDMNEMFYDYFDEMVRPYNTNCEITLYNPKTKEAKIKNHFIVFEHEKTLDACIVVKKKRYYYKRKK